MATSRIYLLTLATAALALSGCVRTGYDNTYPTSPVYGSAPARQVVQSELSPPPEDPNMMQTMDNSSQPMATNVNAPAISPAAVSGVWRASVNGMTCQVATPQTKFGQGYRAGPLNCPSAISSIRSWSIIGNQLVFYDGNGGSVATLYSSGSGFNGQTTTGAPVSLSR